MKRIHIISYIVFFSLAMFPTLHAAVTHSSIDRAERYYQRGDFRKAWRSFLKLAKEGDHYSQYRVAQMFAEGQGTGTDLTEAYAWAFLAAEGDLPEVEAFRDDLLQRVEDKTEAHEEAEKLMGKYGTAALLEKASRSGQRNSAGDDACTGQRLPCRQAGG